MAAIISVEGLSKRYLVGHQRRAGESGTLRDVFTRSVRGFARKTFDLVRGRQVVQGDDVEEFWALQDVNFDVEEGEVLGIIGHNGAGKSTLLKILSRITDPTEGRITLRGRVSSLLEVGTGFHPELSGRENIYLNGAILGMTRAEIRKKFDEIVAFAEVERFLDTPVKRYSSGMYVRLAFAVAAHLEPEVLIVDEVLAVGDADFQRKCLGKMEDVAQREGRTVLVVSHNMGVVKNLCARAIWLEQGRMREWGESETVIGHYLDRITSGQDYIIALDKMPRAPLVHDDRVRFQSLEWLTSLPLQHGEPLRLRLNFAARVPTPGVAAVVGFKSAEGSSLLTYFMGLDSGTRHDLPNAGSYAVELEIDSFPLGPGLYNLDVTLRSADLHFLDSIVNLARLEVVPGLHTPAALGARFQGGAVFEGRWAWGAVVERRTLDAAS